MMKEKNQNELTHPAEQEGMDVAESGNAQDMASSRKKIVDGIHEVFAGISQAFEGLAQMFEGVSEQMDGLGEAAEYAEEEELLKPLKVMGAKTTAAGMKQGATVKKPRKTPEKKAKPPVQSNAEQMDDVQTDAPAEDVQEEGDSMEASQQSEAQTEEPAQSDEPSHPEEDTLPWEEPKDDKKNAITKDELTAVIVAKIKQNRKNNEKIGKLLSAYGVSALSDLPAEKYEAFLTDISQI